MTADRKWGERTPATLALADGTLFRGSAFGASKTAVGEVVFNTSMTGYQEILTDPSYTGQMVCMTYPLIGNYGIAADDNESRGLFLSGFIVKELSRIPSNWRSVKDLGGFLAEHGVPGLEGIDTRKLVRKIREAGALNGALSTDGASDERLIELARTAPRMEGQDLASRVTSDECFTWTEKIAWKRTDEAAERFRVVAYDFGIKHNILRALATLGCDVEVVPAHTPAETVLAKRPDGIFLSNGPGDPEAVSGAVDEVRKFIGRVPIFGICLGHQILGLALGAKTVKLKFGHHGANHPIKRLATGEVEITSQNHGFAVDPATVPDDVEISHVNLNDNTVAGIRHKKYPAFAVQYHPEASPGPRDPWYLFGLFIADMKKWRDAK